MGDREKLDDDFTIQARARIGQLKRSAEEVVEALGLSREAKYDVLAVMYADPGEVRPAAAAFPAAASAEEVLKQRVYALARGFIDSHLAGQAQAFQSTWDLLKSFTLEELGGRIGELSGASGLAFARSSQGSLPVISVVSWAILFRHTHGRAPVPAELAQAAEERGCSRALSHTLVGYLQARLGP